MRFTVITATYNREKTLPRVYESLCRQTHKDFEWLIIDDGSTDGTEALVQQWTSAGQIDEIRYIYKDNGGKHSAWRIALEEAVGPYVTEIDSDDALTPNALEIFDRHWRQLEQREDFDRFVDIRALCCKPDGSPLSKHRYPADVYDGNLMDLMFDHHLMFENAASWHLERLRDGAPIPDRFLYEDKAKNFAEGIRWARAAKKYNTRFINEVTRVYHFDGENSYCRGFNLHNLDRFYNNIVADKYFVDENIGYFRKWPAYFLKAMIRFTSNSFIVGHDLAEQYGNWDQSPTKALWLGTLPAGAAVYAAKRALLAAGLLK